MHNINLFYIFHNSSSMYMFVRHIDRDEKCMYIVTNVFDINPEVAHFSCHNYVKNC